MRADIIDAVGPQQAGMHLFLSLGELAPPEIAHQLGSVRHCLKRPQPDHTGRGSGIEPGPVDRSRLLFHHPPAAIRASAVQIVVEGRNVGMTLPQIAAFVRLTEPELLQKPQWIAVPAGHIEVATDIMVIEMGEETHEIMDDIASRRGPANDIGLSPVEPNHLVGREAPKIQQMRWIGFGHRQVGKFDLVKTAIVHAPEAIAPSGVQRINRLILVAQPVAKRFARRFRIADYRVMAPKFIVGLPSSDGRMIAITASHGFHDPSRSIAISFMRKTIVPPRSEPARPALLINRDHVGHGIDQPFGRGRCRRPHDDP